MTTETCNETVTLAKMVRDMRKLQKDYFRTRNSSFLMSSKAKEKEIDAICERILGKESDNQKKLF
jgi:hypothetical protein